MCLMWVRAKKKFYAQFGSVEESRQRIQVVKAPGSQSVQISLPITTHVTYCGVLEKLFTMFNDKTKSSTKKYDKFSSSSRYDETNKVLSPMRSLSICCRFLMGRKIPMKQRKQDISLVESQVVGLGRSCSDVSDYNKAKLSDFKEAWTPEQRFSMKSTMHKIKTENCDQPQLKIGTYYVKNKPSLSVQHEIVYSRSAAKRLLQVAC